MAVQIYPLGPVPDASEEDARKLSVGSYGITCLLGKSFLQTPKRVWLRPLDPFPISCLFNILPVGTEDVLVNHLDISSFFGTSSSIL